MKKQNQETPEPDAPEALATAKREAVAAQRREQVGDMIPELVATFPQLALPGNRAQIKTSVLAAWDAADAKGEPFDVALAMRTAVHEVTGAGLAPAPKVEPIHGGGPVPPRSFLSVQQDRERYRKRLRELGLLDPSVQSVPGDGGGLSGGPTGGGK